MTNDDRFRPSTATSEGQMLFFTESLGRSRYGRAVALVMLFGGLFLACALVLAYLRL
jgi:hypothetical protein